MNILFIISASIAIKRCNKILKQLSSNNNVINCILTDNALKMINIKEIKKNIKGKVYTNKSEKNNGMLHIELSRKNNLIVLCPATANTIAKFFSFLN